MYLTRAGIVTLMFMSCIVLILGGCSVMYKNLPETGIPLNSTPEISPTKPETVEPEKEETMEVMADEREAQAEDKMEAEKIQVDVISVEISGSPSQYQLAVEISSPDTGCEQYADWWEVLSEGGELIYRRVLLHSHVNEQPFRRSGGPVEIGPDTVIIIRGHMNQATYGGRALQGTIKSGFKEVVLPADFYPDAANEPPLPTGCNF